MYCITLLDPLLLLVVITNRMLCGLTAYMNGARQYATVHIT